MTFQETVAQLRLDAGTSPLVLNRSTLNLPGFGLLLDLLEVSELSLELLPSGISETDNTFELRGRASLLGADSDVSLRLEPDADQQVQCTFTGSPSALTLATLTHFNLVPVGSLTPSALPEFAFAGAALKAESKTRSLSLSVQDSDFNWKPIDALDLNLEGVGFALSRSIPNGDGGGNSSDDPDDAKSVTLSLSGSMRVGSTPLTVTLQLPTNTFSLPDRWVLSLSAKKPFSAGLSDLSQLLTNGTAELNLPPGLDQLAAFTLDDLAVHFDPVAKTYSSIALSLSSSEPWELVPSVSVEEVGIHLLILHPMEGAQRRVLTEIFGQIKFGDQSRLGIKMIIPSGGSDWFLTLTEPLSLSGLAELVNLPGGLDVESLHMPGEVSNANLWLNRFDLTFNPKQRTVGQLAVALSSEVRWNIISQLQVEAPSISLQVFNPFDAASRAVTGGMRGMLTVTDTQFLISADKADLTHGWLLSGGLQPGATISLASVARDLLDGATFPDELPDQLSELEFSIQPTTKAYTLKAGLDDGCKIAASNSDFRIDALKLSVSHTQDAATDIDFQGVMHVAGVAVAVNAARAGGGWKLEGKTDDQQEIDFTHLITELFHAFGFDLPANLPEVTLKNLHLQYDFTKKDFAFRGDCKLATKVVLGEAEHDVDTNLDLKISADAQTGKRTYAGFLRGTLMLGGATFVAEYDFGDASVLKASWDGTSGSLKFADLADSHGIEHSLQVPGGLPLELDRAAFEFDMTKGRFVLSANSKKYGEAFFIASNANKQWDFAFGILINFSEIPGFPSCDALSLDNSVLILSTVRDDKFAVPTLPDVPPPPDMPAAAGRHAFPALGETSKMRLAPGVSVAALLKLGQDDVSNVVLKNLKNVVGKEELLIQAAFDDTTDSATFLTYLDGSLTLAGSGDEKLVLSNVYVKLNANPFGVLLSGSVLIPFNHVTLEASGALAISEDEMEAIFSVKAEADGQPAALPSPFGLRGVELDELDIEVGATFEPPSVDLGIEGKFNIVGQTPSSNDFTIVLTLEGEIPNLIYLSTHIESLTVNDVIAVYTGENSSDAPAILKELEAEKLSMYWSETAGITLPDGTLSQQGFGFNGMLTIAGFAAHAGLSVGAATGVFGDAQMSPIDHSVFSLTGNGRGVTVKQTLIDGAWQTLKQPPVLPETGPALQTRDFQIIDPGGATIALNSKHSPFIDVSAKVSLFNLVSDEVEIEVTNGGFKYKQRQNVGGVFRAEFDCAVSKSGLSAHSQFDLDIKGDIPLKIPAIDIDFGTISLDVSFDTTLDVAVNSSGFTLKVSGEFDFDGIHMTMPELTITEEFDSLEQLPGKILKQIEDNAEKIFKDFLDIGKHLLDAAEKEAAEIASKVADEAKQVAAEAEQQAKQVVADAKATFDSAVHDAEAAEAKAKEVEQEAEKIVRESAAQVAQIAQEAGAEVEKLGAEAGRIAADAEAQVEKIGQAAEAEAKQIAAAAEQAFDAAVNEAKTIIAGADQAFDAIKNGAEAAGEAIVNEANVAAAAMEAEAEQIGAAIEEKAREAAEWVEHQAESAWNSIKKY